MLSPALPSQITTLLLFQTAGPTLRGGREEREGGGRREGERERLRLKHCLEGG